MAVMLTTAPVVAGVSGTIVPSHERTEGFHASDRSTADPSGVHHQDSLTRNQSGVVAPQLQLPDIALEYGGVSIQPDPSTTILVPDGEYTFTITTRVEQGAPTERSTLYNPWLNISVSADGTTTPVITGVLSRTNDYNVTTQGGSAQARKISTETFSSGSVHRALVRVRIPEGTNSLTIRAAVGRGDSGTEISTSRQYGLVSRGTTPAKLATIAEARSQQATKLNRTYESLLSERSLSGIIDRGMGRTLVSIRNYAQGLFIPSPADKVVTAAKFAAYFNSIKSGDDSDQFYGPWFGPAARAQVRMLNNGFTTIELNRVEEAGNSSYILERLSVLAREEAEAWRNGNRERAIRTLKKQREYLMPPDQYGGVDISIPGNLSDASDVEETSDTGDGSEFTLFYEAQDQHIEAGNKPRTGWTNERAFKNAEQFFLGVQDFSLTTSDKIANIISRVQDPTPRIDLENEDAVRSNLSSTGTFTARFNVSNAGGLTSNRGYTSLVYSEATLNITDITKVDAKSSDDTAPGTNTLAGETPVLTSGGDREDIEGTLTNIYEQFVSGETNVYAITFNRTGDPSAGAYINYRAAFQPTIHDGTGQSTFVRAPGTPEATRGQQGWGVYNVSHGDTDRERTPPVVVRGANGDRTFPTIQAAIDNASAGDQVIVDPGTYRERLRIAKNLTVTAPDGARLDGSTFEHGDGITIPGGSGAAPVISGFTITGYEVGIAAGGDPGLVDSDGTVGNWTITDTTISTSGTDAVAVDASQTSGAWSLRNVTIKQSDYGVRAPDATGAWTIRNSSITATKYGIRATQTTGDWLVGNTSTRGDVGVDAYSSDGDWVFRSGTVVGGLDADYTAGDWRIRSTRIENAATGVRAERANGAWSIHRSAFVNISVRDVFAYQASPEGDATRNWWGGDGATCEWAVDCSNPLSGWPPSGGSNGDEPGTPPEADLTVSGTTIRTDATITLDASGSADANDDITRYEWDLDADGTYEKTGTVIEHAYSERGVYNVRLRVTDSQSHTDTTSVNLTVKPSVLFEIREVNVNRSSPFVGDPVRITAAVANVGLDESAYRFSLLANGSAIGPDREGTLAPGEETLVQLTHTFDTAERMELTVDDFLRRTTESPVTVVDVDARPTVRVRTTPKHPVVGEPVTISLAGSYDRDGAISTYRWDLDRDGTVEHTGATYTYSTTDPGVFEYDVRLVDDDGHGTSVSRSVAVHRPHDWPGAGLGPGRTGSNPHTSGPTEDRIAWTADLFPDQRYGGGITAGPVVGNGTVFVGTSEEVRAYDAVTGRTEWSNATGSESISVWGDVLLVSGAETATGFDVRTGKRLWQRDLPRAGTAERGRPAMYQGVAYFPRGLALDIQTGETVWTTPWDGNSLAIGEGNVFLAFPTTGRLRALDVANGSVRWEAHLDRSVGLGTPVVANGTVFVGDENITAVNASTGEIDWSRHVGENTSQVASPAVANGQVYFTTENRSDSIGGRLYVVDADSGVFEWSAQYPDWGQSSPAVVDGVVYVGSDACEVSCDNTYVRPDGKIWAFDTQSGHELWNDTTEEGVTTSPAISNGSLYMGNGKGVLLAFGEDRGDPGGDASRTPTNVSLVPDETTVHPGEETEFTLVVENATEGLGSYTATIEAQTPRVVAITGVHLAVGAEGDAVSIAGDNSVATIDTTGLNMSDTGTVAIATVTVEGKAPGAASLNLSVSALSGEAGEDYRVADSRGTTLEVVPSPIGGFERPPTDPDGDGLYEDINGNGEANVVDVQAMFVNRKTPGLTGSPEYFDFSGNGEIDVVDVQALFAERSS